MILQDGCSSRNYRSREEQKETQSPPSSSPPRGTSPFVRIHLAWASPSVPARTGSAPPQPQAGDTTWRLPSAVRQSHLFRASLSPQLVLLSDSLVRMQARGLYKDPTSPIWQSPSGPILCRGPVRASRVTASAPKEKSLPGHHRQIVAAVRLRSPQRMCRVCHGPFGQSCDLHVVRAGTRAASFEAEWRRLLIRLGSEAARQEMRLKSKLQSGGGGSWSRVHMQILGGNMCKGLMVLAAAQWLIRG